MSDYLRDKKVLYIPGKGELLRGPFNIPKIYHEDDAVELKRFENIMPISGREEKVNFVRVINPITNEMVIQWWEEIDE